MSNLRQVTLALVGYQNARGYFPNAGTFADDPEVHRGDPSRSSIYRSIVAPGALAKGQSPLLHSWVVDILPYLDAQQLYDSWDLTSDYLAGSRTSSSNAQLSSLSLKVLVCPTDPTVQPGSGNLSYAVNGGFSRWHAIPVEWVGETNQAPAGNGGVLEWAPKGHPWRETQEVTRRLGVMFLGTQSGDAPWDVHTSAADLRDGAATTLLAGENTRVGFSGGARESGGLATNWACPLPTFAMFLGSDDVCHSSRSTTDCLGGQLRPTPQGGPGRGWARANDYRSAERINGASPLTAEGGYPFANSGHEGGACFGFCDGSVRFLSQTIDGAVYARLITPAGQLLPSAALLVGDGDLRDEL